MTYWWLDWGQVPAWLVGVLMGYVLSRAQSIARDARAEAATALREVHNMADEIHGGPTPEDERRAEAAAAGEERRADEQAAGDERRADERASELQKGARTERLGRQIALAVVVLVTAGAAIIAGVNNSKANEKLDSVDAKQTALDKDQADFEARIACQQAFLEAQSIALKARSNFAEEQARVQLRAVNDQIDFLVELSQAPPPGTDPGSGSGDDTLAIYIDSLKDQKTAIQDQLTVRNRKPYPQQESIVGCNDVTAESPKPPVEPSDEVEGGE